MVWELDKQAIEKASCRLPKPVRLALFTTDSGCETCAAMVETAQLIKQHIKGVALETYDMVMDRDKSDLYVVRHVPTFVMEGADRAFVSIQGMVKGVWLRTALNTIKMIAGSKRWFSEDITSSLSHLENDVTIRVFVEEECDECVHMAASCIGLALGNPKVRTDVVIASYFPELRKKLNVTKLPVLIFGNNLRLDGHATSSDIIETVFHAEGLKEGPNRHCLICTQITSDLICTSCKNRVQAEAFEQRLKSQRSGHETF
jgi:hypothetical protein